MSTGSSTALLSDDFIQWRIQLAWGEFLPGFYLFPAIPPVGILVPEDILLLLLLSFCILSRLVG
jgi:hypothetical protein